MSTVLKTIGNYSVASESLGQFKVSSHLKTTGNLFKPRQPGELEKSYSTEDNWKLGCYLEKSRLPETCKVNSDH